MNSASLKPFESKTFFLDLSSYPYSAKLSKDLAQLGAKEVFSIPSASFVVSDRPSIKADCSSPTPFSGPGPRSISPLFRDSTLDYVNSPAAHSPIFEQKYVGERVKPMSRALSILMKANEKTQGLSHKKDAIIDLCKRWNIKIYPLQKVLKFIEKYKMKHLKDRSSKRKYESEDVSKIAPPYIKIEDIKREFRPKYKSLSSAKIVDSVLFKCVKSLVKNKNQSTDVKNFVRPVLQEMSVMTQILKNEQWKTEPASITKPPGFNSVSNSMSICVPSTIVKEGRKNQATTNKTKKEKKKSKKEYCEICRVHYTGGETHFEKESHKKFLENSENFAELEELISSLPSVEDFIAKIQKEEEEHTKEIHDDEIQLFDGPISMESCSHKTSINSAKQIDYGIMTERYSFKDDEIISSSCSCPSTPLPYLQERETVVDKASFSDHKRLRNEVNILTNQEISGRDSQLTFSYNVAGSNLHENNFSHISETLHPNNVYYSNVDNNYSSPLNLSYDNQTSVMCPVQRITGDVYCFGEKQTNEFQCPSKTLLTNGESLNDCISLCLPTDYHVSSATPLDLRYNSESVNVQSVLDNLIDVVDNIAQSNLNSAIDITKSYTANNLNCIIDNMTNTAIDPITSVKANIINDCNDQEPVLSVVKSGFIKDQISGSNCKLNNADCDTEIYSSESESNAENLNEIIASCIKEVDEDLENNSSVESSDLNKKNQFFCVDAQNNSPSNSLNHVNIGETSCDDSSLQEIKVSFPDFPVDEKSTVNEQSKSKKLFNEIDFNKNLAKSMSPPPESMQLESQNLSLPNETVNIIPFAQSNMHEKELNLPTCIESCEYPEEDIGPPAKRICLQSENFHLSNQTINESFDQSSVHEQRLISPKSIKSVSNSYLQEKESADSKLMESSNVNDFSEYPAVVKSPPAKRMCLQNSLISDELNTTSLVQEELASNFVVEQSVSHCSKNAFDINISAVNSVIESPIILENSDIPNCTNESSVELPKFNKVDILCKNASNDFDVLSGNFDTTQHHSVKCLPFNAENSDELVFPDIDDSSIPPILEPIDKNSDEYVFPDTNDIDTPPILVPMDKFSSTIVGTSNISPTLLKKINSDEPPILEAPVISLQLKCEKISKVTFMTDLNNVNTQFHCESLTTNSPSEIYEDIQHQHLNTNDMFQSFSNKSSSNFEENNLNKHRVHFSGDSVCEKIYTTLCEVQEMNSSLNDIEKAKRISKAIEASNISLEKMYNDDVFIILDDINDSENDLDLNESNDLDSVKNMKLESPCKQLNQVITRDIICSFNEKAEESGTICNVVNNQMAYMLNVYEDPGKKCNMREKELDHTDKAIIEEVKACLNDITCDAEIIIGKTDAVDNVVKNHMNSIPTIDVNFEEESHIKVKKEEMYLSNFDVTSQKINTCANDIMDDSETKNERKIAIENDIDCFKKDQKQSFSEIKLCVSQSESFVKEKFHNYTKYRKICDKEVRILIPKLTVAEYLSACGKNDKNRLTDISSCGKKTEDITDLNSSLNDLVTEIKQLKNDKNRLIDISSCGKKTEDITDLNSSLNDLVTEIKQLKQHVSFDVSPSKSIEPDDGNFDIAPQKNSDEACNTQDFKTSENYSSELHSSICKVSDIVCETIDNNTSVINSSVNESFNTSSSLDSRSSNESTNYAGNFCSIEQNYINDNSDDDVQNKTVHIIYLNSPQPLST